MKEQQEPQTVAKSSTLQTSLPSTDKNDLRVIQPSLQLESTTCIVPHERLRALHSNSFIMVTNMQPSLL